MAYGIQKLQVGCVIEDDKVLTDDIFDKITCLLLRRGAVYVCRLKVETSLIGES